MRKSRFFDIFEVEKFLVPNILGLHLAPSECHGLAYLGRSDVVKPEQIFGKASFNGISEGKIQGKFDRKLQIDFSHHAKTK